MADQILSQEEIDALLGAMANGEVDLDAEEEKKNEVIPYDLTSKSVQLEDEFSALDEVFDKFASVFRKSLSALLQREVQVEFDTKEVKAFDKLIKHILRCGKSPAVCHIGVTRQSSGQHLVGPDTPP